MTTDMENEIKNFKGELYKISGFMREQSVWTTVGHIHTGTDECGKVIKDNLDTAKKTGQPFF